MCTCSLKAQSYIENVSISDEALSTIDQLNVKGNITLYLKQATEPSLIIQGKKNIVKQVKTNIKNRSLSISKNYTLNDERVVIFLTISNLKQIITNGNVIIETPTNIWLNNLSLNLSDESEVTLYVNSNDLNLSVKGSGNLELSGYIDTLKINGSEESNITGTVKSIKLSCRASDYSNISLNGTIFKAYFSAFNKSIIDFLKCEIGMSSIVAFDESIVRTTSLDVTDIYAFDKSVIHYKSQFKAFVMESSNKSTIKKELIKITANK